MAAPHVSGTAALVASLWPEMTADLAALKSRLLYSGKPVALTAGKTVTGRLIDAYRALDSVGPLAKAPTSFGFVVGTTMTFTGAVAGIGWPHATDDRSGVAAYGLQVRAGGGAWTTAVGASTARTALRSLAFGTSYAFGVRARDGAGNWGSWSSPAGVTPARYQESSSAVTYTGTWGRLLTVSASNGQTRYATRRGASVTFRFTGRAFALIAPKGPTRGSARLYVDGVYVSTVSLYRSVWVPRIVVAARSWLVSGAHTARLVLTGTPGHSRFDVDAFAVLR
jgi:hypothetical protein